MNYIEIINRFWKLRRSKRITNLQADLYSFLLQESSSRGSGNNWENPFQCANGTICSAIGISEKSLIDARNVLQQHGLIQFEGGVTKQKSPVYYLPDYWNKVSNKVSIKGGKQGSNPVSIPGSNQGNTIKEETKQKLKRNETSKSHSGDAGESEEKTEYWKILVAHWFSFYKIRNTIEPSFLKVDTTALKSVLQRLKKMGIAKQVEWSEQYALKVFDHFLQKAVSDSWMAANLTLPNLSNKFDVIVNPNNDGTGKNGKSVAGSKVTGEQLNEALNSFYKS